MAARSRNRPRIGLAWFFVVVLSGLIALCTRAAAAPASGDGPAEPPAASEPASDGASGEAGTSLDLLELDPLAALDTSRLLSAEELAILAPTVGAGERDDLAAGDEIAAAPPPSRWGRIDLGVSWRREVIVTAMPRVDDQLWLVVTWRR